MASTRAAGDHYRVGLELGDRRKTDGTSSWKNNKKEGVYKDSQGLRGRYIGGVIVGC